MCYCTWNCSSAVLKINSSLPGADVLVKTARSSRFESIGKTPLLIVAGRLKNFVESGATVIVIEKKGYRRHEVIIPVVRDLEATIDVKLLPAVMNYKRVNGLIASVFQCQRLLKEKKLDEAKVMIMSIEKQNDALSVIHELYGTLSYFRQAWDESFSYWSRVVEMDPHNIEAQKMLELIATKRGQN